jgi:hypothetical protein
MDDRDEMTQTANSNAVFSQMCRFAASLMFPPDFEIDRLGLKPIS